MVWERQRGDGETVRESARELNRAMVSEGGGGDEVGTDLTSLSLFIAFPYPPTFVPATGRGGGATLYQNKRNKPNAQTNF